MEEVVPWAPYLFDNSVGITSTRIVNYAFDQFAGLRHSTRWSIHADRTVAGAGSRKESKTTGGGVAREGGSPSLVRRHGGRLGGAMGRYLIRRTLFMILVLFVVSLITFIIFVKLPPPTPPAARWAGRRAPRTSRRRARRSVSTSRSTSSTAGSPRV